MRKALYLTLVGLALAGGIATVWTLAPRLAVAGIRIVLASAPENSQGKSFLPSLS